jgi:uncharacterized protein
LQRNYFFEVRDSDFQRGINKAVANNWTTVDLRNRYRYLCYEGTEKVFEAIIPNQAHAHEAQLGTVALNPRTLEDEKVASAIRTDLILSAEIMAITLAAVADGSLLMQALVLALVGIGITVAVYGVVALIVKADDVGVALAKAGGGSTTGRISRAFGRAVGSSVRV